MEEKPLNLDWYVFTLYQQLGSALANDPVTFAIFRFIGGVGGIW